VSVHSAGNPVNDREANVPQLESLQKEEGCLPKSSRVPGHVAVKWQEGRGLQDQ